MRSFIFALLPCVLLMSACETDVNDVTFHEYKELLVVKCFMQTIHGYTWIACEVSRTLPPGETYSLEKAWVTDAVVTYSTETSKRLTHQIPNTGLYRTRDSGLVGKTVTLTVSWNGKTATAQQHIPLFNVVDTMTERQYIPQLGWHRVIGIRALPDVGRVEVQSDGASTGDLDTFWPDAAVNGMYYSTIRLPADKPDTVRVSTRFLSSAFEEWMRSRDHSGNGDWIFPTVGKNPRFNVHGDGIGFFYTDTIRDTVIVM